MYFTRSIITAGSSKITGKESSQQIAVESMDFFDFEKCLLMVNSKLSTKDGIPKGNISTSIWRTTN
jgi:hypothetical protein